MNLESASVCRRKLTLMVLYRIVDGLSGPQTLRSNALGWYPQYLGIFLETRLIHLWAFTYLRLHIVVPGIRMFRL